jgi:tetratricopeptide (TPR) repeat protein
MIYYKQEKFSLAEMHFQKALDINPQSSVLLCHIGVVSNFLNIISVLSPFLNLLIDLIIIVKNWGFWFWFLLKQYFRSFDTFLT